MTTRSSKRKAETPLAGMIFAITGALSVSKAEFESLLSTNGGSWASTVTNKVTHLVSADKGTRKCQEAKAKGVAIVDETWVRAQCGGGGGVSAAATPAAPPPAKKAATASKATVSVVAAVSPVVVVATVAPVTIAASSLVAAPVTVTATATATAHAARSIAWGGSAMDVHTTAGSATASIVSSALSRDVVTDLVISFDTTGSMYPCLSEVRRHATTMTERLFREIPSLRVAIIAHGDYCDGAKVLTKLDFTADANKIKEFIQNAPATGGGDYPECYELVLRETKGLSWRFDATMKSLILIGDAPPHEKNENPEKIDWRDEADALKNRNIQVFSVQCLNNGNREAFKFYSEVAIATNGYHVFLDQFSYLKDMIMAICYKQVDNDSLDRFQREIQAGGGGMGHSMRLMFDTMLGKKTREQAREEMHPDRFREKYSRGGAFGSSSISIPAASSLSSSSSASALSSSSSSSSSASAAAIELRPSPPSRFQVFEVDGDINIKDFCDKMSITFRNGRGFYEFTKPETIQKQKEIILMEKATGELYEGAAARAIAGISDESDAKVKPTDLVKYRMFIQSTSPSRKLIKGQGFLYEVAS